MPCGANDERLQRVIAEKKLLRVCKPRFSPVAHKMQKLTPPVRDNLAHRRLAAPQHRAPIQRDSARRVDPNGRHSYSKHLWLHRMGAVHFFVFPQHHFAGLARFIHIDNALIRRTPET